MPQDEVELVGATYRTTSVMTIDSVEELSFKKGDTVHILAKAVNVLLMKP